MDNLISVWKVESEGFGYYFDADFNSVSDMLKDVDFDEPLKITKTKMDKTEYENLPEFNGF